MTGGDPRVTGIYYDDEYSHGVFPAVLTVRKRRECRRVSREHHQRARTPRECECFRVSSIGLRLEAVPAQCRQRRLDRSDGVVNGRLFGLAR